MKIEISPRALREIERKAKSWAEHSTLSPDLFWEELDRKQAIGEPSAWVVERREGAASGRTHQYRREIPRLVCPVGVDGEGLAFQLVVTA